MKTVEQKAKAYDEAIERAKKVFNRETNDREPGTSICEYIFPELAAESEDERIKNEIIKFLELPHPQFVAKRHQEKWITWLEKQGKPTDINPSEFDLRLNELLKQFETLLKEELVYILSLYLNVVQNDGTYKHDEKQGKQKPTLRERYKNIAESEWFKKRMKECLFLMMRTLITSIKLSQNLRLVSG